MKLFELKDWDLVISEEAYGLVPFQKLIKRDKTKNKSKAIKELEYIFFSTDMRSPYLIMDEHERFQEIKNDLNLPKDWEPDAVVNAATEFYKSRSATIASELYDSAVISARAVSKYLRNTEALLNERDKSDKPIYHPDKIIATLAKLSTTMSDLDKAYDKVVKERQADGTRTKGSQTMNLFEDGLSIN